MKKIVFLLTLFILAGMVSCDDSTHSHDSGESTGASFSAHSVHLDWESFVIPDSVNTDLIAATYYDVIDPGFYGIILYTDTSRLPVTILKYYADSVVRVNDFVKSGSNTFQSKYIQGETYTILEKTVLWTYQDANLSTGREYTRTDKGALHL